MAYVLFGLAWWHRASGEQAPLDWASRTMDYLDAHLRDPRRGGYRAAAAAEPADADDRPRELAAQMHLLEAFQALHQATGEGAWLARAEGMVAFIRERLLDRETGSLGELYTADWAPRAGLEGQIREPGDNFEVAWMLYGYARLTGDARTRAAAEALYEFSLRHGVDSAPGALPAAFAQVTRRGRVVNDAKPLWAQTELVKAALGRLEGTGDPAAAELARGHLGLIFRHYLVDRRGLWRNELARDGSDARVTLPVRVLYHLVLCFAEVLRLRPQLQARDV
jgi:mannose/cellobiose epimerase-like protein (N-acyl-D-glucosamine 2-epimerase family)